MKEDDVKKTVLDRFLRYVRIDTQSDATSKASPSSEKQWVLLNLLVEELHAMGITNAIADPHGVVYASLEGNTQDPMPALGLVAHVDTASELSGANVQPRVIDAYDGGDILLNAEKELWTRVADFPVLSELAGHRLVVTDGTTLLGADDKAGVAEIMTLLACLVAEPEIEHGPVKVAFTPDEEIGRGTEHFDVQAFGADFAYTLDGDKVGTIEYENFHAASASVVVKGRSIHPGAAKGKLVNAMHIAMRFHSMLPVKDDPALTEHYEGFNHLTGMRGEVNEASLHYILRNHDADILERQKQDFRRIAEYLNAVHGAGTVVLEIKDTYRNMRAMMEAQMWVVDLARQAIAVAGIKTGSKPIRGGTDGANLTCMGLPCPNLGTGGRLYHGRHELVSVDEMEQAVDILLNLVQLVEGPNPIL